MTTSGSCNTRIAIGDDMALWQDRFVRNESLCSCNTAPHELEHSPVHQSAFPWLGGKEMAWNGLARMATPLRISTGHRNTATYPYPDIVVLIE